MTRYERMLTELDEYQVTEAKCFGNSMVPLIESASKLTFERCDSYEIGDIVFCKVKGRYIDAHKIVAKNLDRGYLIANNHGHENGWTKTIYAKVIEAVSRNGYSRKF